MKLRSCTVNVSGEYGLVRLKELGEELKDRMEQIPSILRVDLRGGLQREVKVDVDLAKLTYYEVSLDDVISAIRWENVTIPGGSIEVGSVKYLVRVDGEFDDPLHHRGSGGRDEGQPAGSTFATSPASSSDSPNAKATPASTTSPS